VRETSRILPSVRVLVYCHATSNMSLSVHKLKVYKATTGQLKRQIIIGAVYIVVSTLRINT
jgi:hypothetical protein